MPISIREKVNFLYASHVNTQGMQTFLFQPLQLQT